MITIQILFLVLMIFIAFMEASLLYATILGAPTVYANRQAIIDSLRLSGLKSGETLIDLGCGDGKSLIIASKEFGAKGIGVDRSLYCYLVANFKVWLAGERKNIRIIWGDFRRVESDLAQADVVYLYLLNSVLAKIEPWLFKHIGKDTRVVSLAFQFPDLKPEKVITTKNLRIDSKVMLYRNLNR
ncbi:MAG TPA: class I SAM-dependent methyltransferase [bacterium]|nr:class I SAM-dependent methyltransferase [bacterium]